MSHPFLKSIHPVNLLSFGPKTEPIELRPLNILIGPNGCGKSNLIEIIRLLYFLPEKEPWAVVLQTGGVSGWMWKGEHDGSVRSSLAVKVVLASKSDSPISEISQANGFDYSIQLSEFQSKFRVTKESLQRWPSTGHVRFESNGVQAEMHFLNGGPAKIPSVALNPERSVLSQVFSLPGESPDLDFRLREIVEVAEFFESFDFHQDWEFGVEQSARDPRQLGQPHSRLEEDAYNLAEMLAFFKENHPTVFDRVEELMRQFYAPFRSLEIAQIGDYLQIVIQEEDGITTLANRLSDGTLRWLALITILLNPDPAPVTCLDEPELGLHPDIIPALSDLVRDASTRTQLIVTTHSTTLVDAFSDDPDAICV